MPPLDLLEARVASGSLTTCSNPLLFIGNLFPRNTKVQGFSNTGSVGLGVIRSGLALMTSLVNIVVGHWIMSLGSQARGCRATATLFLVLSSLSLQSSTPCTSERASRTVHNIVSKHWLCSGRRIRLSSVLESDLMVLTVALFCSSVAGVTLLR